MKVKFLSFLALFICAAICLAALGSCDLLAKNTATEDATEDSTASESNSTAPDASTAGTVESPDNGNIPQLDQTEWDKMISEASFENYTLNMSGIMTVTVNGEVGGTSDIRECVKVGKDKVAIYIFADENANTSNTEAMIVDGEIAKAQKLQYSQLFMTMLKDFQNFTYDEKTNTYRIPNTITIETVLKGLSFSDDGQVSEIDVPTAIVMREATVTVSEDGKLLQLVCDYTQTMKQQGVSTSGKTTWSFSDYGTTVVE